MLRFWELWCEAYLHKRTKQRLSTVKAQIGRGQVSLKRQRRSATPPSAYEGAQNHRTLRLVKLARQAEDLVRQFQRHVALVSGLSVVSMEHAPLVRKTQAIWRRIAERSALGCCEAASFPISEAGEAAWRSISGRKRADDDLGKLSCLQLVQRSRQ